MEVGIWQVGGLLKKFQELMQLCMTHILNERKSEIGFLLTVPPITFLLNCPLSFVFLALTGSMLMGKESCPSFLCASSGIEHVGGGGESVSGVGLINRDRKSVPKMLLGLLLPTPEDGLLFLFLG